MKIKNPYIATVAIFMLSLFIYSCRKEFMPAEEFNPKVSWAKDYFTQTLLPDEGNIIDPRAYIQDLVQANRMSNRKDNLKIPIWQRAIEAKTPLFDIVEVPLKYTTKVTPMISVNKEDNFSSQPDNAILKASFDRLVIYKNKKGKVDQRIVSFVPSRTYLDRHKGDISHNSTTKLDKDFEGLLVYRKWDGNFLFALYLKDGKTLKKVALQKPKMQVKKTSYLQQECETVILWEWFQVCYYEGDNEVPYFCDPPYKEQVGEYEMCWETDPCNDPQNAYLVECGGDGGNGEEPGGGGNGNPPNNEQMDWGNPTDEDISIESETEYLNSGTFPGEDASEYRYEKRKYSWTFHRAINEGFWLKSYEKGRVKKQGTAGSWQFWSFQHLTQAPVGMVAGREIEIVMIDSDVYFSPGSGTVNLWYKIHRIGTGFGTTIPYYSSDFQKERSFSPNQSEN